MIVGRKGFKFDAAHYLPNYEGKCRRLHGHTWYLDIEIEGPVGKDGFIVDFTELKSFIANFVLNRLDHSCLNDLRLPFSSNPTCERILEWVWGTVVAFWPKDWMGARLVALRLYESPDSYAEITNRIGERNG